MSLILSDIFKEHGIELYKDGQIRNLIDILEDLYLRVNGHEYDRIMQKISEIEKLQGHIFDQARNRPYK